MCQRVVIALALACNPQLLIADEPTTGLDVTTQKAVMDLIVELTKSRGMSTILITHDLGLAAAYCDRVVVMEKGNVVETALSKDIFAKPEHPYTRKLMRATPRLGASLRDLLSDEDRAGIASSRSNDGVGGDDHRAASGRRKARQGISASRCTRRCLHCLGARPPVEPEQFRAVDGISFSVNRGESVGLVGESGCGKSTTSMMVMRLLDQTSGRIVFDGEDIGAHSPQFVCAIAAAQADPDGVSGSHRQPQSAVHGSASHCRSDRATRRYQGCRRVTQHVARNWRVRSAYRYRYWIVFRTRCLAARKRVSASLALSL